MFVLYIYVMYETDEARKRSNIIFYVCLDLIENDFVVVTK